MLAEYRLLGIFSQIPQVLAFAVLLWHLIARRRFEHVLGISLLLSGHSIAMSTTLSQVHWNVQQFAWSHELMAVAYFLYFVGYLLLFYTIYRTFKVQRTITPLEQADDVWPPQPTVKP